MFNIICGKKQRKDRNKSKKKLLLFDKFNSLIITFNNIAVPIKMKKLIIVQKITLQLAFTSILLIVNEIKMIKNKMIKKTFCIGLDF